MNIGKILKEAINQNASDIILTSGNKPSIKTRGEVKPLDGYEKIEKDSFKEDIFSIMTEKQKKDFLANKELDFSITVEWLARFRVNVFSQRDGWGAVLRPIATVIPDFDSLGLPEQIKSFTKKTNGIVLITGSVWSGKSTTLASLINEINKNQKKHIVTVEDPIEFVYQNENSIIEQREVWPNTLSFDNALKYALRQAPDVILVWEMRDLDTFRLALRAAETGNLVFATLHTSGAARTIARVIDMFPGSERDQIRQQLSESLIWVVWQSLLKWANNTRVAATEILVNNTSVANMIRKEVNHQLGNVIETGAEEGMMTMKKSLNNLLNEWRITQEVFEENLKLLSKYE